MHSRKEQEELDAIKQGVKLENGELHVQYQFCKDPRSLPNNRALAVKTAKKLEKCLITEGHLGFYNQEFKRGV